MRLELTGASVSSKEFEHSEVNSRTHPGWVRTDVDFVATDSTVGIRFIGISPDSGFGMMLDDVSLVEVQTETLSVKSPGFEQLSGTDPAQTHG